MEHVEYTYTVGMDEETVGRVLRNHDVGVLSLADDNRAYGLPVHYHFDGDVVYLRLIDDEASRKMEFLTATEEASFLVYGFEVEDGTERSWSVVVTGTTRRLTDEERAAYDDAAINEDFGPMRIFGEGIPDIDVAVYVLEPDSITGRRTEGADPEE